MSEREWKHAHAIPGYSCEFWHARPAPDCDMRIQHMGDGGFSVDVDYEPDGPWFLGSGVTCGTLEEAKEKAELLWLQTRPLMEHLGRIRASFRGERWEESP